MVIRFASSLCCQITLVPTKKSNRKAPDQKLTIAMNEVVLQIRQKNKKSNVTPEHVKTTMTYNFCVSPI